MIQLAAIHLDFAAMLSAIGHILSMGVAGAASGG